MWFWVHAGPLIQANVKKNLIQIKNQIDMDVCINATVKLKYT